jgi:hypothetical protein
MLGAAFSRFVVGVVARHGGRSNNASLRRHQFAALTTQGSNNATKHKSYDSSSQAPINVLPQVSFDNLTKSSNDSGVIVAMNGFMNIQFPREIGTVGNSWILEDPLAPLAEEESEVNFMNRNGRAPRKANKGKRPCSRVSRRRKKSQIGRRKR